MKPSDQPSHIRMKPNHRSPIRNFSPFTGTPVTDSLSASGLMAFLSFMLLVILTPVTTAQSAANFDTDGLTPEAPASKEGSGKAAITKDPGPISLTPSRRVDVAEMEPYLESMSSVFLSRSRAYDPFGQSQDPDAKPVIKASTTRMAKRAAPVQITPFSDIVRLIVVTTIMPGEKSFLVGTRSIKQGDTIPLSFRGKQMQVKVTEVTSRQIAFQNLDNGEMATRKLDMLPVGMTPGNRGITAPGMYSDSRNAPIELESGNNLP